MSPPSRGACLAEGSCPQPHWAGLQTVPTVGHCGSMEHCSGNTKRPHFPRDPSGLNSTSVRVWLRKDSTHQHLRINNLPGGLFCAKRWGEYGGRGRRGGQAVWKTKCPSARGTAAIAQWACASLQHPSGADPAAPRSSAGSPRGPQAGTVPPPCHRTSFAAASHGRVILSNLHPSVGKQAQRGAPTMGQVRERGQNPNKAPSIPHHPSHVPEDRWAPSRDPTRAHKEVGRQAGWYGGQQGQRPSLCHPTSVDRGRPWLLPSLHRNDLTSHSAHPTGMPHLLQEALHPPHPGQGSTVPGWLGTLCSRSSPDCEL